MIEKVSTVYLGLGSNLGDRAANLLRAITALKNWGLQLSGISSIYESDPVDYLDQPKFLNVVIACQWTGYDPFSLLNACLQIESRLGRERTIPKGARTIDIDLLLIDDQVIDQMRDDLQLTVPHPRLHLRRFVLMPFAELAPQTRHPILGEPIYRLLGWVSDPSHVRIYRE
jgi:2-amino-4-hydroxy-6-hydroxymethyldihydropteridine diphosphokinase